jgi:hypothetical protein
MLLGEIVPAFIGLLDIFGCVGFEFIGAFAAPVQIELAVDDFKSFRVHTGSLAGR